MHYWSSTAPRGNSFDYTTNRHEITVIYLTFQTFSWTDVANIYESSFFLLAMVGRSLQVYVLTLAFELSDEESPAQFCYESVSEYDQEIPRPTNCTVRKSHRKLTVI